MQNLPSLIWARQSSVPYLWRSDHAQQTLIYVRPLRPDKPRPDINKLMSLVCQDVLTPPLLPNPRVIRAVDEIHHTHLICGKLPICDSTGHLLWSSTGHLLWSSTGPTGKTDKHGGKAVRRYPRHLQVLRSDSERCSVDFLHWFWARSRAVCFTMSTGILARNRNIYPPSLRMIMIILIILTIIELGVFPDW